MRENEFFRAVDIHLHINKIRHRDDILGRIISDDARADKHVVIFVVNKFQNTGLVGVFRDISARIH